MIIGESGAVSELWEAARRKLPRPRLDRPGQPVYAISEPPAAGRHGSAPGDGRRSRPARPLLRGGAPRGARRRPAAARPGRLPLAHARPDRGGALVALGRGRRDPLQGGGIGLDTGSRAAAAGLDRPTGTPAGLCRAGAARPDPAPARGDAHRLPLRPRRELRPRSGSTSRSGCSTCSTIAPSSCERAPPRAARPRELERRECRQRRPARARALAAGRRGGAGARRAPRGGADRPRRQLPTAARAGDPRGGARRPRDPARRRAAPRRDRVRLVRRRRARRLPRLGVDERRPTPPRPGGGETRVDAAARIADGLEALLQRPRGARSSPSATRLPIRYVLDAADGRSRRRGVAHVPHAAPFRLERHGGRARRRDAARLGRGARVRGCPFRRIALAPDGRCILSIMHVRRLHLVSRSPRRPCSRSSQSGCGGSAVAVPELTSFTSAARRELRRRLGEVRARASR